MVLGDASPGVCDAIHAAFCPLRSRDVALLAASGSEAHPDVCLARGRREEAAVLLGAWRVTERRPMVDLLVRARLPWSLTSVSLP